VVFSDIVGFTSMSSKLTAEEVVSFLNELFGMFDNLAEAHGLEKIKTIGDAYMAVAGVPSPLEDHADRAARMGLGMIDALAEYNARTGADIQVRIGIHSGHVVAGVIGKNKFMYDLWGDTVNTASRMESNGVPGAVQISEQTRALLGDGDVYGFTDRGLIDVKGKGKLQAYLLTE
jgi:adenylate cyclase